MNALRSALTSLSSSLILQQAGWLAAAKIVQGICSVSATLVVARHLGPTGFGSLSLAVAIASFVATAAALGLEHIATRELAEGDRARLMLPVLRRMRIAGALLGGLTLVGLAFVPELRGFGLFSLLLVLALLPLAQIGDVSEWQLIAAGRSRRVALVALVASPAAALARLGLALAGQGIVAFAWVLVGEWTLRSILLRSFARELGGATGPANATIDKALALLRDSMPLLMAGIAVFIYMRIDQFMIAALLGQAQVGLYSAVVTLAEVPLILPALLLRAALPTLTRQSSDAATRDRTLTLLMGSGFYLHAALALVLAAAATPIVTLLYGEAYRAASMAFRLQVLAAPFVALGVLSSAWLVLERRTSHALRRTVIGALVNIGLNLLLIPRHGIAGAAAATLVAQIIATYLADAGYAETRILFSMKTQALLRRPWRTS